MIVGSPTISVPLAKNMMSSVEYWIQPHTALPQATPPEMKFWHDIKLLSNSPFSAKKVTIASGPYQGCQAIIIEPEAPEELQPLPAPTRHLGLMDLPIELRLKIYQMLFDSSDPVILRSDRPPTFTTTPSHFFSQSNLAITGVCRQIRSEILPVVYGGRTFQIDSPLIPDLVVEKFLVNIGNLRKHLRFLRVGRYADSHWSRPDMFNRFLTCPNLRRVHFHVHAIGKSPEDFARFFYKSARLWLHDVAPKEVHGQPGLDIISFSNLPNSWPGNDWNENGGKNLTNLIKALLDDEST
ncbi:MAG: hypothetical protein M1821_009376 [Bathelium mastoideum]|nr:MAG: hypothetical protein M1821_009376 [Bathelium mastoideum]